MIEYNIAGWFGGWELLIIFGAILLLFGGRKIPELMKGIGKGVREFNRAKEKVKTDFEDGMKENEDEDKEKEKDSEDSGK
ncbi:MAG: twin-arginine translocase TatA/TatE family subunit [Bacteroidota bacterium]|nr:twin-arginine translocase TatA/TatE family subunit [Bacteroidota bacterium]